MSELRKPGHLDETMSQLWDELKACVRDTIGEPGLEALCSQVRIMRDCRRRIEADGLVVADQKGNPVPHPAIEIEKKAQAEVRNWIKEFRVRSRD